MEDQSVPLGRVPMKIRHMWFGQALKELLSREVRQGFKLAAFDGSSFFTSHKLPVHPSQAQQQQQQEQQECLRATVRDNKRNARISVTVTYVGELSRERMSASHGQVRRPRRRCQSGAVTLVLTLLTQLFNNNNNRCSTLCTTMLWS